MILKRQKTLTTSYIKRIVLSTFILFGVFLSSFSLSDEVPHQNVSIITAEELISAFNNNADHLRLIDSRLASDRRLGFIEGSVNLVDTDTNCISLGEIAPDNSHLLAFYCNGPMCVRSGRAVQIAQGCGYQHILWFKGGYEEWRQKNYPVLKIISSEK